MRNIKICTLLLGGFLLCASACGGGGASLSPDSSPSPGGQKVNCEVAGVEFGVSEISDVDAYAGGSHGRRGQCTTLPCKTE